MAFSALCLFLLLILLLPMLSLSNTEEYGIDLITDLCSLYGSNAICQNVDSYKWLPIRTMVAMVYFHLGTLLTQAARQDCLGAMLLGTMQLR